MKKLLLICFISVASVQFALAQHFISLSGQFGEHSWVGDVPSATLSSSFGLGTGLGVSYELKVDHFLLSLGVTGNYSHSTFFSHEAVEKKWNDADLGGHTPTVDGVRGNFTYVYDFFKRQDAYQNVTVQVPLMLGGTWNKFYFLLGAKFETFTLWGKWNTSAAYNTYGAYDAILGEELRHMPEHGFFDKELTDEFSSSASFNLNVLASAEIGAWLVPEQKYSFSRAKTIYRVGAYVDCGALNAYDFSDSRAPYITPNQYVENNPDAMRKLELVDLLSTDARTDLVLPFELGVKFTVMFRLPAPVPCVICQEEKLKSRAAQGRILSDKKKSK